MRSWLKLSDAVRKYDVPHSTLVLWCKTGKVNAVPIAYGSKTSYLVDPVSLKERLKKKEKRSRGSSDLEPLLQTFLERLQGGSKEVPPIIQGLSLTPSVSYYDLLEALEPWKAAMAQGIIGGKPFSKETIRYYAFYVRPFIQKHKEITAQPLKRELLSIPVENFAKREKLYKAVVCFGKFLISENMLEPSFLEEIKPLVPKRHRPPKRNSINEQQLEALLKQCQTIRQRTTVLFLASTGLRASEFCDLQWPDLNFDEGYITVRCGKGGKARKVGMSERLKSTLLEYKEWYQKKYRRKEWVFLNKSGQKLHRHGLRGVLEKLGKKIGLEVTPHVLRRAFVTINANKGRPLNQIQIAAGHADIKTTMKYCRTSEDEVIKAMKGWD